jgi:hypothetical protein
MDHAIIVDILAGLIDLQVLDVREANVTTYLIFGPSSRQSVFATHSHGGGR